MQEVRKKGYIGHEGGEKEGGSVKKHVGDEKE